MATKVVAPPRKPPSPPSLITDELPNRNPAPRPPRTTVYVRCCMPAIKAWIDYERGKSGEIREVTNIWALKGLWATLPFATERGWSLEDFGLFWMARKTIE